MRVGNSHLVPLATFTAILDSKLSISRISLLLLCLGLIASSSMNNFAFATATTTGTNSSVTSILIEGGDNSLHNIHNNYGQPPKNVQGNNISDEEIDGDDENDVDDVYLLENNAQHARTSNGRRNPQMKLRPQTDDNKDVIDDDPKDNNDSEKERDSVLILSAVDGTLAGVSRSSGQILWRKSRVRTEDEEGATEEVKVPDEWNAVLSPLVSTTSKALSAHKSPDKQRTGHEYQWQAVPSIDGTVYLTGGGNAADNDGDGYSGQELSVSIHIRDLVNKAPFVDAQQRFFVGSRRAMVAALDERTGEILRVIPKWNQDTDDDDGDGELPSALEGRDVVWVGRLEHTVIVHDLRKGTVDFEFSVAEILSVEEMIHGDRQQPGMPSPFSIQDKVGDATPDIDIIQEEEEMNRIVTEFIADALRHPGDRILRLPAPDEPDDKDIPEGAKRSLTSNRGSPFLVSTPTGNVAFRDDADSSTVGWISFDMLDSPVVYAIEASTGHKIRVNMLDDSSLPLAGTEKNSLSRMLEQQIASLEQSLPQPAGMIDDACRDDKTGECRAVGFSAQGSVVGALQNGQIYALPLGERISRPRSPLELPQPHPIASEVANVNSVDEFKQSVLSTQHATIGFHEHRHDASDDADSGDKQLIHLDDRSRHSCTPASPLYPGCLIGASIMLGNLLDMDGNLDMASVFASSDLDYDLYLDMLEGNSRKKNSFFQRFVGIMSSWIAPLVALIFVVSFEIGRRERLKAEAKSLTIELTGDRVATEKKAQNNSKSDGGVIQLSDEILGYGGHGTIVYKGVLDKRQVAVKRMLNMYHASADREISLLIESDGHPNVVRYFLKEMRGDFVYLALELCDMSLNDLIVSMSKYRNMRKESIQPMNSYDDFELATKILLHQIASGVRHLHSLRIVHRDLKPQNILLALRSKSKPVVKPGESESETELNGHRSSTCIDTTTVVEYFKNQDYVPKISDMGLGKQLAGQSSFGLSTLGTGSVGGGLAGDAGAGAGSVGWQAPEVMAQRWSPEASSNDASEILLEASPIESGVNRTSRSVDIFSLGCIFFCTLLPGYHPFGEWYEREANIMKNTPNRDDLEFVPPEARDLILLMISRDAKARPTADEVCEHPFFWSMAKRLKFLCDVSDRIESFSTSQDKDDSVTPASMMIAIEKGAVGIVGTSWEKKLDPELMEASLSRRTYDPSSLRDCLRMIRNKHHHYDELPASLKTRIGSSTDGLSIYITRAFPGLLMHCYNFCVANLGADDSLSADYKLPISRNSKAKSNNYENMTKAVLTDMLDLPKTMATIPDDEVEQEHEVEQQSGDVSPELEEEPGVTATSPPLQHEHQSMDVSSENPLPREDNTGDTLLQCGGDLSGIVVWSGSTAARELKCRGWYRSDDDWTQRLDAKLRKRDSNLARFVDDPKFRTRLCNYWDSSQGVHCPMRKKNKCIFAHGPIELRVKGGKHHRWGTLVNKFGICANPRASGGEDTYGAARTIEKTRKEQGQWAVDSKQKKPQVAKQGQVKKKTAETS